jgi:hypothetical protein
LCLASVTKTKFNYHAKKEAYTTGDCTVKPYYMGKGNPPKDNVHGSLEKDSSSFIGIEQCCQCFRGFVSQITS